MGTISRTQGMKLEVGNGASTEVFTAIAGVTDWNDSGTTRDEGDCVDLDSTGEEVYGKLPKFGSVTVDLNIVDGDTEHQQLIDDADAATAVNRNYRITRADGTTVRKAFNAFVKTFSQAGPKDSHITASVELRLTGTPTNTI